MEVFAKGLAGAWRAWWARAALRLPESLAGRSLRSHLVWLVLACVLPAALAAGVVIVAIYQEGRAALVERAQTRSRLLVRAVDAELNIAIAALQALATSPALLTGDLAAFDEQARRALPHQAGSNIVLLEPGGQQRVNTLVRFGDPLPRDANLEMLRLVVERGEPVVSDLFIGGVTRKPLIAVGVPVKRDGRVAYCLAMGFFPDRIGAVLARLQTQADWEVTVLDRDASVVASMGEPERFVGQKPEPGLQAALARGDEAAVETRARDGTPVLTTFSRSPATGWSVIVGVPARTLLARLRWWVAGLAVGTLALIVLGAMSAQLVARRIEGPIAALVAAATALEHGRAVSAPTGRLREAETVASALERAARLLATRTTERDHLAHLAAHDPLTGLSNRAHFVALLEARLAACRGHGGHCTVLFIDLDDFKPVNDMHGHAVGDELLRVVATRLRAGVRQSDTVARFGGDEFALLLEELAPRDALGIANELIRRLSRPYGIQHLRLQLSACIGVAGYPDNGTTAEALLEAADAAMYRAKASGKRHFTVSDFTPPSV
ncbi:MAG TPA: sensor domain-containing diguanylate cyclase [Ideonella sp.]|nr:sensor domain-containing diguanylate cyclase [Ideonella sp.]